MSRTTAIVLTIVSLLGGAALGWFLHPTAGAAGSVSDGGEGTKPRKAKRHLVDDVGQSASLEALRSRVKELERLLAEARRPEERDAADDTPRNPDWRRGYGPPGSSAHIEEIRRNDPERYAAMTNGMAKARDQRLRNAADRLDILASVDVSRLSQGELAVHERLQAVIAREQELSEIARFDNPDTTDEMRRSARDELRSMRQQKHELERKERDALLKQTAASFGVRGSSAKELVDTVKAVYKATQSEGPWHQPPPHSHPRRRD